MKILVSIFVAIIFSALVNTVIVAQDRELTVILVRHAEKETSEMADKADPALTPEGRERAQRLVKKIGKYRPGAFYSTDYKRTRDTVIPLAEKRNKKVQIYDARQPQELIEHIMQSKTKRFVIAGHSNTIPGLANLITKKELFKNLDDSEYTVIWLIRLKNGKVTKLELLDY